MVKRDQIIKFINQTIGQDLLDKSLEKDENANGVQFLGSDEVNKIALGVSLNHDFLLEAQKAKAQMCIFHHGYDAQVYQSLIPTYSQKRLKAIIKNNFTILGFHYCLDAHPKIGNNAMIIKKLGAQIKQPFWEDWGYTAEFSQPQDINSLSKKCAQIFEHDVFAVLSGPKKISKIGVVSGRGTPSAENILEMEQKEVELYISGETSEWIIHRMKESNINYFACGHYATEVFGVQELGRLIKKQFKNRLEVEFIDIPNPI